MLVDAIVSCLLVAEVFAFNENGSTHDLVRVSCDLFDHIMNSQRQIKDVELCVAVSQIDIALETKKNTCNLFQQQVKFN